MLLKTYLISIISIIIFPQWYNNFVISHILAGHAFPWFSIISMASKIRHEDGYWASSESDTALSRRYMSVYIHFLLSS